MNVHAEQAFKIDHAKAILNTMDGVPAPYDDRAAIVAKYLIVVEEDVNGAIVPRVRVAGPDGKPKMIGSLLDGRPEHYPIDRLIKELVVKAEPALRWKWPL